MNFSRSYHDFSALSPASEQPESQHLRVAIIVSIFIHIGFLWVLRAQHFTITPDIIEIELTSLPEIVSNAAQRQEQKQIVAPTEKRSDPLLEDKPKYRSDIDSSTAVEQIKRGDDPEAGIPNAASQSQAQQPAPEQADVKSEEAQKPLAKEKKQEPQPVKKEQKASAPEKAPQPPQAIKESHQPKPLKQLALDNDTLMEKYALAEPPVENARNTKRSVEPSQYQAFSRPPGTGARFVGQQGTNDYLPNLPDGDITLLNTKADQFAVFVRRVATQVFGEIRNTGWEVLAAGDINSASRYSTFRAVLSLQGKLLRVEPISDSGSIRFDRAIEAAVKQGARDQNPPPAAAASDGLIHFIFQARSWSQVVSSPRSGAPMERRWLLLSTGLE
jgi:hypothetical protein